MLGLSLVRLDENERSRDVEPNSSRKPQIRRHHKWRALGRIKGRALP